MSASKVNANGGFGGFLGVLFLIAVVIKFFWWILGALTLVGIFFLGRALARWYGRRAAEYTQYSNSLAARADEQHGWVGFTASKGPNSWTFCFRRSTRRSARSRGPAVARSAVVAA